MLFNSYAFIFGFLPLALIGYQIAGHFHRKAVVAWLGFASLCFYAYWRPVLVVLLLSSIAINYIAASLISRQPQGSSKSRLVLWSAITADLGLLVYFKYLFPLLEFLTGITRSPHHWGTVLLPLGISFFTFTQIAYLVDLQQGNATLQDLSSYVLFVTFFPHLIAGPILHHKEMMPQFNQQRRYKLRLDDLSVGFSWFLLGLGKKVIIADYFAATANLAYGSNLPLPALLAWRGVLSYAFQLYFDFSGYSDMALGLARMFSIDFPLNFSSPYKATNVADFWQRWHITLTKYIMVYLYNPMQFWITRRRLQDGKKIGRKGIHTPGGFASMVAFPMLTTMFIAGIWHGAGFQFIIFGVLHGLYLTVHHAWTSLRPASTSKEPRSRSSRYLVHASSVLLTFFCVLIAQVFFRANSTTQALSMLASMFGFHGFASHNFFFHSESKAKSLVNMAAVVPAFFIVWALPNTQQILSRFKPALSLTPWDQESTPRAFRWAPTVGWALGLACVFLVALVQLQDPSSFLYFQF